MSRKVPHHAMCNEVYERNSPKKPQKLPSIKCKHSFRDFRCESSRGNQSSSSFIQDEERRVQERCVKMLMIKLANKEKEVEMLRCKQNVIDAQSAGRDLQQQNHQKERDLAFDQLTLRNQELQRQVQILQTQCQQHQKDSKAHHTAALEHKRLLQECEAQAKNDKKATHHILEELQKEQQQSINDRIDLRNKLHIGLQKEESLSNLVNQLEFNNSRIEGELQQLKGSYQHLQEALVQEQQKRMDAETLAKKIKIEKVALEDKQRRSMKILKVANSKATDMEKKHKRLSQGEKQLAQQLTALQSENSELKARKDRMAAQIQHLQTRLAILEGTNAVREQKLESVTSELESARKFGRDTQFRIKELLEEVVFLKNRKRLTQQMTCRAG
ncbi:uncharacterized protein PHALS_01470 [Plasmopara halstedii]|uniref:Uncharacterized protein n=1 Tax=Plasmopara halstedii TaxID=4781 RepID=A0A0P1ATW4_PLAHL|nr:uncharacterized protein PHALS_01470 [Plasmopara halstedii]CEG45152.1 hypothetical protein PHALS_01470 [Plasmopara halstedii]|eukprot:XP_024581521.1 hypothetical protein PHALS_01470 [Plasmopara halstedii]